MDRSRCGRGAAAERSAVRISHAIAADYGGRGESIPVPKPIAVAKHCANPDAKSKSKPEPDPDAPAIN